ncbi:unnamed protein product [Phytophthora fragariaefolia]|uniref:Unnamed protein product n=1 Tax=Phytophthora fragariaefolia TaxID=1490495 RepID=A0A9W7CVZ8_9STRA|nr:unnamed protein product [Phytophthora fragariaefolia]
MPRGTRLTPEEIGSARALYREGKIYRYIAKQLVRTDKAIRNRFSPQKTAKSSKKVGRPSKITQRLARRIFRLATVKKYTSKKISEAINHIVKPSTVHKPLNSLRAAKWIKRKPAPTIKPHHKIARAAFAAKVLSKTRMWRRVIFSGEKKFNLDGPDGYQDYWHDVRADTELYAKRVSGGGSVMVSAGMSANGKTDIMFLEGRQDSACYTQTLDNYLAPFIENLRENH